MGDTAESPTRNYDAGDDRREHQVSEIFANSHVDEARLDEWLSVLVDHRRRSVLRCLKRSRTPMALAELADEVARWETGEEPTAIRAERERIYVSLYHRHLPKLAEANLVSVDLDRERVSPRDDIETVLRDAFLEL